ADAAPSQIETPSQAHGGATGRARRTRDRDQHEEWRRSSPRSLHAPSAEKGTVGRPGREDAAASEVGSGGAVSNRDRQRKKPADDGDGASSDRCEADDSAGFREARR